MNKNHSCGSCKNFTKFSKYGLCELYDYRTFADHKIPCEGFKRIKFHRDEKVLNHEQRNQVM